MSKTAKTAGIADSIADKLVDEIISAIADHSGDPRRLAPDVDGHSVSSWRSERLRSIGLKGVGWGAVEGGVPIVGVLALIPDLRMLIGDSVRLSWGIGELKGCRPMGAADALEIMALWSGSESHGFRPVSTASLGRSMQPSISRTAYGSCSMIQALPKTTQIRGLTPLLPTTTSTRSGRADMTCTRSYRVSERQRRRQRRQSPPRRPLSCRRNSRARALRRVLPRVAPKILAKTSSKMAAKAATHVVQHGTTSWIPGLGAVLGAGAGFTINRWFASDFADAAADYYSDPLTV